ncbi:MAG TPA: adenylate/guanylate cyclase domain-containing protein [Spirochaetota bacterium]|nr:adenylate/guanylate cyclase domain-containing protein [Spirochaetota bacterium]HQA52806.1 adenylate/guanylate cyclase domain-containing protein [Spirochaetota bacterium]
MADIKKKRFMIPISLKMIFIISLVIILSFSLLTYISTYLFTSDSERNIESNTIQNANLISQKVKSDFLSVIEKSKIAILAVKEDRSSNSSGKNLPDQENDSALFSSLLFKRDPNMIYIGILSKEKSSVKETKKLYNEIFLADAGLDSDIFSKILDSEKESVFSSINGADFALNLSSYFGRGVIGIIIPYESDSRAALCIMFSNEKVYDAVKSPDLIKSFLVNGRGELLAHYDKKMVIENGSVADLPIVKKMLKSTINTEKIEYVDSNSKTWLGAYNKTGFSDTGVISIVSKEQAFGMVRKLQKQTVLIALIVLNLAILFVYFFSKTITKPIRKLVSISSEIRNGKFDISVKSKSRDEIGILSESFEDMARGLAEREKMKDAFGKFVNKEIADMILKNELKLGGERKTAAVFFSDIRSFTAISENLQPEEVVDFLNEYMSVMVDCVNKTNGVVDKFIGDAIMAVWGTPISRGNDTANAVEGALMMREALKKFNKGRGSAKKPVINIGCGINTGPVLAGQIGSHDRMEYTVIGDTVNLASRIESLNKPFCTDILISSDSYNLVKDLYLCTPMEKITVKGKKDPQQIYAVISRKSDTKGPRTLKELREYVGIKYVPLKSFDPNSKEEKYAIVK